MHGVYLSGLCTCHNVCVLFKSPLKVDVIPILSRLFRSKVSDKRVHLYVELQPGCNSNEKGPFELYPKLFWPTLSQFEFELKTRARIQFESVRSKFAVNSNNSIYKRSNCCFSDQLTQRCQIYSIRTDNSNSNRLRPNSNCPIRLAALSVRHSK